jgi:hypothetical protein
MSPLQFVKRERITYAQQLIRETARSIIDIGMEEDRSAQWRHPKYRHE